MRKTLTALLIAAALPTVALAATPAPTDAPPPAPFMKDHGPGMHRGEHGGPFRELNLTQDQRQQIGKLMGTTKDTIQKVRERSHWNSANIKPRDPVILGLCSQSDLNAAVTQANERLEREGRAVPVPPPPEADEAA